MIYRVVLKISYHEAYFEFDSADQACNFARIALEHSVTSEDCKKMVKISMVIVNPNEEEEED